MKFMNMSEARHDFNSFPKVFATEPDPIIVTHGDDPEMVIAPFPLFQMLMEAFQFLKEKNLLDEYFGQIEAQMEEDEEEDELWEGLNFSAFQDKEALNGALQDRLQNNEAFRASFEGHLSRTREAIAKLQQDLANDEALLASADQAQSIQQIS